jgi:hypothetical protein
MTIKYINFKSILVSSLLFRDRQILTFSCYFTESLVGSMEERVR